MIRGRSSSLLGVIVTAVIAVPSAAFVMQRTLDNSPEHRMELTSSTGAVTITNSREGQAILNAAPMVPGASIAGTVDLSNDGNVDEQIKLDAGAPVDSPGPAGGRLSERLLLRVESIASDGARKTEYDGALSGLDQADLGVLDHGDSRTYRFVVTFPDGGANGADNAYQGSSASVGFEWLISEGATTPDAGAPLDEQVIADAPVGYWPLDGSQSAMTDATGAHTGTFTTTVVTAAGEAPGGGHAAAFDGTAAYGYVNDLAAPVHAYTMEAWVKPAISGDMTIMEHGTGGSLIIENGRFVFRHLGTPIAASGSGSSARASSSLAASAPSSASVGRWHLVVGTWTDDGGARLFVDGELVAGADVPGIPSGSATFYIARGNGGAGFFSGAIAQVAYYGADLDADRVTAHWNAGKVETTAPTEPTRTDPTPADPGPGPSTDAGPSTGGDTTPSTTTPTETPGTTCPGAVTAAGGQTSMWAILNARAKTRAKARAKKLAQAKKQHTKARGKARTKPRATKKTKRTACAGARAKGTSRSG